MKLIAILFALLFQLVAASQYSHHQQLNSKYDLYWTVDYEKIYLKLDVETLGWVRLTVHFLQIKKLKKKK